MKIYYIFIISRLVLLGLSVDRYQIIINLTYITVSIVEMLIVPMTVVIKGRIVVMVVGRTEWL